VTKSFSDHVVTENRGWKMFGQPLALKRGDELYFSNPCLGQLVMEGFFSNHVATKRI
jgi:hypothetical protein